MEKEETEDLGKDHGNDSQILQQNKDPVKNDDNSQKNIQKDPLNLSKCQLENEKMEGKVFVSFENNECKSVQKEHQASSKDCRFGLNDTESNETSLTKSQKEKDYLQANDKISLSVESSVNESALNMKPFHKENLDGTNSSEESIERTKKEMSNIMVDPEGSSTTANFSPPKTPIKKSLLKRNNIYSEKKSKEAINKQNEEINVATGNNKESVNLENHDRDKIKVAGNIDISKDVESKGEENVVKEQKTTESISKEQTKQIEKITLVECNLKENDCVSSKENYDNPEKEIIEQNKEMNVDKSCNKQSDNIENQKRGKTKELGNDIESNEESSKDIENEKMKKNMKEQTTIENISKEQTKQSVNKTPIEYNLKESHELSSKIIDDNTKKEIMKQNNKIQVDKNCSKESGNQEKHERDQIKEIGNNKNKEDISKDIENKSDESNVKEQTTTESISKDQTKQPVKKTPIEYNSKKSCDLSSKVIDDNTKKDIEQKSEINVDKKCSKESDNQEKHDKNKIKEVGNTKYNENISKDIENISDENVNKEQTITENIVKEPKKQLEKDTPVECNLKESDGLSSKINNDNPEKGNIEQTQEINMDTNCNKELGYQENHNKDKIKNTVNHTESNENISKEIENISKDNIKQEATIKNVGKVQAQATDGDTKKEISDSQKDDSKDINQNPHQICKMNDTLFVKSKFESSDYQSKNDVNLPIESNQAKKKEIDSKKNTIIQDIDEVKPAVKTVQEKSSKNVEHTNDANTHSKKKWENNERIHVSLTKCDDINKDNNISKNEVIDLSKSTSNSNCGGEKNVQKTLSKELEYSQNTEETQNLSIINKDKTDVMHADASNAFSNVKGVKKVMNLKDLQKTISKNRLLSQISDSVVVKNIKDISIETDNNVNNLDKIKTSIQLENLTSKENINVDSNKLEEDIQEISNKNELSKEKSLQSKGNTRITSSLKDSIMSNVKSNIQKNKEELVTETKGDQIDSTPSDPKISKDIEKDCMKSKVKDDTEVECVTLSSDSEDESANEPYVCKRCENIWSNNILNKLFKGDEPVTVNSRITYGAIILINRWVVKHYDGDREELVRSVLERADLGKNVENLRISQVNDWLGGLMRSGKIKCCDVFAAVYKAPVSDMPIKQIETVQNTSGNIQSNKNTSAAYRIVASSPPIVMSQQKGLQKAQLTQTTSNSSVVIAKERGPSAVHSLLRSPPAIITIPTGTLRTPIRVLTEGIKIIPGSLSRSLVSGSPVILRSPLQPGVPPVAASTPLAKLPAMTTSTPNSSNVSSKASKDVMPEQTNSALKQISLSSAVSNFEKKEDETLNLKMVNTPLEVNKSVTSAISDKLSSTTQKSVDSDQISLESDESQLTAPKNGSKLLTISTSVPISPEAQSNKKLGKTNPALKLSNLPSAVSILGDKDKKEVNPQKIRLANTPPEVHENVTSEISDEVSNIIPKSVASVQKTLKLDESKTILQGKTSPVLKLSNLSSAVSILGDATKKEDISANLKMINIPPEVDKSITSAISNIVSSATQKALLPEQRSLKDNESQLIAANRPIINKLIDDKTEPSSISKPSHIPDNESLLKKMDSKYEKSERSNIPKLLHSPDNESPLKKINSNCDKTEPSDIPKLSHSPQNKESPLKNVDNRYDKTEPSNMTKLSPKPSQSPDNESSLKKIDSKHDKTKPSIIPKLFHSPDNETPMKKIDGKYDKTEPSNIPKLSHSPINESPLKKRDGKYDKTELSDIPKLLHSPNNESPLEKKDSNYERAEPSNIPKLSHSLQNKESQLKSVDNRYEEIESSNIPKPSHTPNNQSDNNESPLKKIDSEYNIKECMEKQQVENSSNTKDTSYIKDDNVLSKHLLNVLNLNPDTVNSFGIKYNNSAILSHKVKSKAIYKENMEAYSKLKEEFNFLSGYAAEAFGLMPFESKNFNDLPINENLTTRFLTNRELLSLQDICVFSPENPNVELFYEILTMLLKSRKSVLLIPDEECLLKVTENIRKEYIRSKKQRNSHVFLSKNWDPDATYHCVDLWSMDLNLLQSIRKEYCKNITVGHILSLFCCWKNNGCPQGVTSTTLQHQLEYLCPEVDMTNIDKVGLCLRMYATYCDFIRSENEIHLSKIFINQKFQGGSTLMLKDDLINKTRSTSTLVANNGKIENKITKNDECTVANLESQVIKLKESLNEIKNSNKKMNENINLYKEKKGKLLSVLNKSETHSLAMELSETIEKVHRMRAIKRKTEEGLHDPPPSKKMKEYNDPPNTASLDKTMEKDDMRRVVIQLLKRKISIDKVRTVIQTIMENVVGVKQAVLPGPQWIRIVAKQEGIALLE